MSCPPPILYTIRRYSCPKDSRFNAQTPASDGSAGPRRQEKCRERHFGRLLFFVTVYSLVMKGRASLLALLITSAAILSLPATAAETGLVLRTQQRENSFIVSPGSTQTLTISVVRTDGSAVPGVGVVFSAPEFGPGGAFPMSPDPDQRTLRLETDASGLAAAVFTTGAEEGVFLVSGRLEGAVAVATFAFTNALDPPAAELGPTEIKTVVQDAVRNQNEIIGLTSVVHGPVLLPAGAVVSSSTPEIPGAHVEPFVLDRASWLLWADDFPFADFGHAARVFAIPSDVADGQVMARAETRSVRWWPTVRLPAQTGGYPLVPPLPPSIEAEDDAVVALGLEGSRRFAPDDACAILLHGPNMPQGEQDIANYRQYLLRNDLVNSNRVLRSLMRVGNSLRYDPISRNDFDRIVKFAAELGCKKVYLMIAAHGNEPENGGGLILQSDRDPSKNAILSFEDYAGILQQLGNVEVCVLQVSCYAGGLIPALQGRGLTGSVITASNSSEPAYHDGQGHFFVRSFIAAKENSAAAGNDGKVSDQGALDYVLQNDTSPFTFPSGLMVDRIRTAMPQGSAVQPTGTRGFTSRLVYISGPAAAGVLVVNRPLGAPTDQPFIVTVQVANAGIATAPARAVVPPGAASGSVAVTGVDCGMTSYTLTGSIGNQTYQTSNAVQVGHFKPSSAKVTVTQGSEVEVKLEVYGPRMVPADRRATPPADFTITSADAMIAAPDNAQVSRPAGSNEAAFKVKGLMPGKTTFDVFLTQQRVRKTIEVEVLAPDRRQSMNLSEPYDRVVLWQVAQVFNINNHPIRLPSEFLGSILGPLGFLLQGAGLPFVPVTGEVNPATGEFTASGNSGSSTIAGFSGVPARATGRIGDSTTSSLKQGRGSLARVLQSAGDSGAVIEMRYTLGDGTFPGGPIEWDLIGTIPGTCGYETGDAEGAVSAAGGVRSLTIVTQPGCAWAAVSSAPWLTIAEPAEGLGPASVSLVAAANESVAPRTATVTVQGAVFTLTQDGSASTRPTIASAGVVNGASFAGAISSGTWITILGSNLAPTTRIWGDADFNGANLPTSLDGVRAAINGRPAYVYFISPGQLNLLAPDDPYLGSVEIVVTTPEGSSDPYVAQKLAGDPALFKFDPEGRRYAAAVHADGTFLGKPGLFAGLSTRPAKASDVILLYGTGFGPTTPPTPSGQLVAQPTPLATPVVVRIGGLDAEVLFAGVTGSGLVQFNVVAPAGLEAGDHAVEIFVAGVPIPPDVYITVEP